MALWNQGSAIGSYSSAAPSFGFRAPPMAGNPGQQYQAGLMGDLMKAYQQAYEQGRQANEQRYQELARGYQDRYGQAMSTLEGSGEQARADLRNQWRSAENRGVQDLTSRGLTGTTILPTMRMGYQRQANADEGRLNESLRQQKLGLQNQLSGDMLSFMERRDDDYPDLGQLAGLAQSVGQLAATQRRPQAPTYSASVTPPRPTAYSQFSMAGNGQMAPFRQTSNMFRSGYSLF